MSQAGNEASTHRMSAYGLGLLMLVYMLNFLDRQIVNILAEPIKAELHISDKQLGMITGLSFALLYTTMGIPLARLAERCNRVKVIAGSLLAWSTCTALCGMGQTLNQLLVARIGVGLGEAGCLPAAHAMIAEYTPPGRRARAISIFMVGSPLGVLAGMAMGGVANQFLGWRAAFLLAALPGLLMTGLLLATLKDPARSRTAASAATRLSGAPTLAATVAELWQLPRFWLLTAGASLGAFVTYAQGAFIASHFLRNYREPLVELGGAMGPTGALGLLLGLSLGLGGVIGMLVGGAMADRLGSSVKGYASVAALSCLTAAPVFLLMLCSGSFGAALALLIPATILNTLWPGPLYAAIQSIVEPHSRATAAAVSLLLTSVFGLGLGPLTVGALSDHFSATLGAAAGLRQALVMTCGVSLVAALCFWAARRPRGADQA